MREENKVDVHIPSSSPHSLPPLHDRQKRPQLNLPLERKTQNAVSLEQDIFFFFILTLANSYSCYCIGCSLPYSSWHLLLYYTFSFVTKSLLTSVGFLSEKTSIAVFYPLP